MTVGAAAVSGGAKKKTSRAVYVKRAKALGVKNTSEKNIDQLKAAIYRKKAAKKPTKKKPTKKKTATKGKKKASKKK